jgi:hypothetical protein
MRTFRIALLVLALSVPASARADAPTPFVDTKYKVGETYTESASLVALGGASYLVIVQSDTDEYFVLRATAPKGVVKPDQIGKPVTIEAKIESKENRKGRTPEIKLEIISAK